MHALDEEEDLAYRAIERKYEVLYQKVYEKRGAIITGATMPDEATMAKFEEMKNNLMDEGYDKLEVPICDVKDIQNTSKGVSSFWVRAFVAHQNLQHEISEKDRPILAYLENIKLDLHETGYGFDLTFTFEQNSYFSPNVLKKVFVMTKPNVVEKCIGTPIEWAAGSDPTKEKKKKNVKQNGKQKTVTTTVKCDSFFNFFETVEAAEVANSKPSEEDGSDDEDPENKIGEQMDHDFDMGNDIKDDIVPLALEYYLGVIEKEDEDSDDEDGAGDDSDDDKPKKKGKGPKVAPGGGPKGPNGEECKQQ